MQVDMGRRDRLPAFQDTERGLWPSSQKYTDRLRCKDVHRGVNYSIESP